MTIERSPRVAFWVTAGGRDGGGHLSRAMALLSWLPNGAETVLVLPDNEYTRTVAELGGPAVVRQAEDRPGSPRMIFQGLAEHGWTDGPDLVVVDGIWAEQEGLPAELRARWPKTRIAVVGGPENLWLDVELRVLPDAGYRPPLADEDDAPGRLVGGAPYVILGRRGDPDPWRLPPDPARVLVTAGNADPFDVTGLFVRALELCSVPVRGRVVLGGGFLHAERVRDRVASSDADLELVERAHDLRPLMAGSDLALSAYGITCMELAQMGVPAITVTHTQADVEWAHRVAALGFLEVGGWVETADPDDLAETVDRLLLAPAELRRMSEAGRRQIDGRGAERVAGELEKLL